MKQLKETARPVVLTVNGKAAAVVQDAEAYQRRLDIAVKAEDLTAIRQGRTILRMGVVDRPRSV